MAENMFVVQEEVLEMEKCFEWTEVRTLQFIQLRVENSNIFTGKRNAAKMGWRKVIHLMGLQDELSEVKCRRKWENLVRKYKELKDPRTGTGTENGEETPISWPYYEAMDAALRERHNISPPVLVSSSPSTSGNMPVVFSSPGPSSSVDTPCLSAETPRHKRRRTDRDSEVKVLLERTLSELTRQGEEMTATNNKMLSMLESYMKI